MPERGRGRGRAVDRGGDPGPGPHPTGNTAPRGGQRGAPAGGAPRGGGGGRGGPAGARGALRGNPPGRGQGRGADPPRAGPNGRGLGRVGRGAGILAGRAGNSRIFGVRRPAPGTKGVINKVYTNFYRVDVPTGTIYHYDADIRIISQNLPVPINMQVIRQLQEVTAPEVFTPRCVFDGRKNLFSMNRLNFVDGRDSGQFEVFMENPDSPWRPARREPLPFRVRVTFIASIDTNHLHRYMEGIQSMNCDIRTAITAFNLAVRQEPTSKYPSNLRSFFPGDETKDVGGGMVLWRGLFQSVQPAVGRMLVNIDISAAMMYKPGPLISLCLELLGKDPADANPDLLARTRGLSASDRKRLSDMVAGIKVLVTSGSDIPIKGPRTISWLTRNGASVEDFDLRLEDGGSRRMSVAEHFQTVHNCTLQYPDILCAVVKDGTKIPLELCEVLPGQIIRKPVPSDKTQAMLEFSTIKPRDRFASIKAGLGVLAFGQSEYVRGFGLHVDVDHGPLAINSRILSAPILKYGEGSKQRHVTPKDGSWNMADKKFFRPCRINQWIVVVYEAPNRFGPRQAQEMIKSLLHACNATGIDVINKDPLVRWENTQQDVALQLLSAGRACIDRNGSPPQLIVVVLPSDENAGLYTAVKHFGDIRQGVATQCLKSDKCDHAKHQYFASVCLKINVKCGGINFVPGKYSAPMLTDPHIPTVVMGADASHPPPHTTDRPSFTALVANVDLHSAKYSADCRVQISREEVIDDLEDMTKTLLERYKKYGKDIEKRPGNPDPKRLIFFRKCVSEGQFQQVLDKELPRIKAACASLEMKPAITLIAAGKRHHTRFVPAKGARSDESGNCPAGTVVDTDIVSPVDFDFYLQSHGGQLGTSRPTHYHVLHDDSKFSSDALQGLCFALCHVYARSTRSVSIPAPVYYARLVCKRAWNHYDPALNFNDSPKAFPEDDGDMRLHQYYDHFQRLNERMHFMMYFS